MRHLASVTLGLCGLLLLLTWRCVDLVHWLWKPCSAYLGKGAFQVSSIQDSDFVLKIAGLVLLAGAALAWPKKIAR